MKDTTLKDQPTYGLTEACAYLHLSETSLRELVDSGQLAASKPSRELVFRKCVLEAYLEHLEREQTEARRAAFEQGVRAKVPTAVSSVRGKRKAYAPLPPVPKAA